MKTTRYMADPDNNVDLKEFNTAINVIGGLKDFNVIFKAIDAYFNELDSLDELVKHRNEFNLRTERSRVRVERAVRKGFLSFKGAEHKEMIKEIFKKQVPLKDKELILFWQFALNNRLFREISSNVFVKIYFSGRVSLSKEDIIAYLKELISTNKSLKLDWTESTINTISTKYLNLMSKLNFVSSGRVKSFHYIKPSSQAQVLFLYFAKLYSPDVKNLLANELLQLSFMPKDDLQDRLKKLSIKGLFDMNYNGVALNIDLTRSYKEICDVLYQ
jgi:hypothetical protein